MSTLLMPPAKRYGVTEKKKSELDALTLQVTDAQYTVQQLQAIVDSLTVKAANFQAYLVTNDNNRVQALNNKNLVTQIVQSATTLQQNSETAFNAIVIADAKTRDVAVGVKALIDKLIYAAEVINKLSNLIIRKKALNPLINDDLVTRVSTAGADANNAVALTLVALQSAYAAQASNLQSEAASALQYTQAMKLFDVLTVNGADSKDTSKSITTLLDEAYENAKKAYDQSLKASNATNQQLSEATANLVQAQIKLRSYQLGLAAANAAALAS
ncbi:hypothetical protein GWR56_13245 [Mucilaginibacter sp. 14171R-50]|uniref:hypothetical protein n=1 Tax=Mucilaginibacter sp. 14171R-50 TaxID=2703789 RepID=UPI00138C6B06|nr:hypothetical protein [Mucilaginibacter sp. 14171R-50]QHS56456.1 hypothetical protein GWR56_13245 [Mucilaginibacter sp. 14171R-50]